MKFNFRNIHDLIVKLAAQDSQLYEALKRLNNFSLDVSSFLNDPKFDKITIGQTFYSGDRNQLFQESARTSTCRVYHSIIQSILDNTATALAFDSTVFDTDGMHDTITNNSRITIQSPGYYLIGANIVFAVSSVGFRDLRIRLNGSINIANTKVVPPSTAATQMNINTLFKLNQGDYLEVQVQQNSGAALDMLRIASTSPEFWAHRLS